MNRNEWIAKAIQLFGKNPHKWRFVCPVCATEQSIGDFLEHTDLDEKMVQKYIAFSCIGRWAKGGCEHPGLGPDSVTEEGDKTKPAIGCDYAGGGLFKLNPVKVTFGGTEHAVFQFGAPTQTHLPDGTVHKMWIVYEKPNDFPDMFVARMHEVDASGGTPTPEHYAHRDKEMLLEQLHAENPGLFQIQGKDPDDPNVIQVWI